MYIAAAIIPTPLCLRQDMTLLQVRELATGRSIRHFPVTDGAGRLVGMVSDRDLRSAFPSTVLNPTVRAGQLPAPRDALLLLDRHRIGALAVVDGDGVLVGIVTVRDVLGAYRRLFGIGAPGSSQIDIRD